MEVAVSKRGLLLQETAVEYQCLKRRVDLHLIELVPLIKTDDKPNFWYKWENPIKRPDFRRGLSEDVDQWALHELRVKSSDYLEIKPDDELWVHNSIAVLSGWSGYVYLRDGYVYDTLGVFRS